MESTLWRVSTVKGNNANGYFNRKNGRQTINSWGYYIHDVMVKRLYDYEMVTRETLNS